MAEEEKKPWEWFACQHCGHKIFYSKVRRRRFLPFLPRVCILVCTRCDTEHY